MMKKEVLKGSMLFLLAVSLLSVPVSAEVLRGSGIQVYLLSQDPDPAVRGDYVTLRWKIESIGSDVAEDVQVRLIPQYPFSLDPGADPTERVGDVWYFSSAEERNLIVKYDVRVDGDAEEGMNSLRLQWRIGNGEWSTQTFEIEVEDRPDVNLLIGDITTSPLDLVPDSDDNQVTIEVQNVGDDAAELVVVEADLPEAFTVSHSGADRDNLGNIPGGSSVTATLRYDLDDTVAAGWYDGFLKVTYKEAGDTDERPLITKRLPFELYVKPTPLFSVVETRTVPEHPVAGDIVQLYVTIKNYGNEEGESVSVRAFKDASQPFDFTEKSDFVGTLAPGETGEAVLELELDKDAAPKEYRVDIETRVVDGENVLVDSKTVAFKTLPAEASFTWLYIVGIVVVLGLAAFWWSRRK